MVEIVNQLTQKMLDKFLEMSSSKKKDLYRLAAQSMFDVSYNRVTEEQYAEAKKRVILLAYLLDTGRIEQHK